MGLGHTFFRGFKPQAGMAKGFISLPTCSHLSFPTRLLSVYFWFPALLHLLRDCSELSEFLLHLLE